MANRSMVYKPDVPPADGSIEYRLREERERMGLSKKEFATLMERTEQWYKHKECMDGGALKAMTSWDWCKLAAGGVDVQYVFVGQRGISLAQDAHYVAMHYPDSGEIFGVKEVSSQEYDRNKFNIYFDQMTPGQRDTLFFVMRRMLGLDENTHH